MLVLLHYFYCIFKIVHETEIICFKIVQLILIVDAVVKQRLFFFRKDQLLFFAKKTNISNSPSLREEVYTVLAEPRASSTYDKEAHM